MWSGMASDTCYDLVLLILLLLLPQCWGCKNKLPHLFIWCSASNPGHCACQVLYQLSHTSNSLRFKNKSLATPGFLSQYSFLSFLVRFLKGMAYKPSFQGLEDARYCTRASRMPSQSLHFQWGKRIRGARYTLVILALEKPRQEDCDLKIRLDYWVRSVHNPCEAKREPMGNLVGLRYLFE